jgi:uncharacterized membrane-anchored protein YjiN (DUF445 family)
MYWFKRKYNQIQRVIYFLPIIWRGFDWDYMYAIELFKHQLKRTEKSLLSETSYGMDSKNRASRIRTAIELMDKVYEEDYNMEWMDKVKKMYGTDILDSEMEDTGRGDGSEFLKYKYEKWENADEITKMKRKLSKESTEKQKKAHKLLWNFIEHNLQSWWD